MQGLNTSAEIRTKLLSNWGEFIMESKGAADPMSRTAGMSEAKQWIIAQIAENKKFINEGYTMPTSGSYNGVGAVTLPASPGSYADFHDPSRAVGSGDPAIAALGLSMSIAAHTIAFDLMPVVPIHSELVMLEYVDTIYAGGKMDTAIKPNFIKVSEANLFADTDLTVGSTVILAGVDGAAAASLTFIQFGRLDRSMIFRVDSTGTFTAPDTYTVDNTKTLNAVKAANTRYKIDATAVANVAAAATISFANPNDDHIRSASNDANVSNLEPMARETAEQGNRVKLELKTWTKPVQTGTYSVEGIITRQQARQFKSKGLDGIPMLKKAMQNEVTQSINDDALDQMRKLGVTNHANLFAAQGVNMHLFIGPASTANKALTAFDALSSRNGGPLLDVRKTNRTSEFGNIPNAETNSSAENLYSRQTRLRSRILAAAAAIGSISRFGAGDAAVVNAQLLAAIKESKGWQASQVENTLMQSTKALYFAGTIADVKIFCNPKMDWNDTTVIVLRTNKTADGNDVENLNQGLVFLPYDLAAQVDIIDPNNMSPRFLVESVYALATTGIHPELAYLTFSVQNDFGMWS